MSKEVDQEEFGWRYNCETQSGGIKQINWCKDHLSVYGDRWSMRFIKSTNQFMFKRKEDYVMFTLAWHDSILDKSNQSS